MIIKEARSLYRSQIMECHQKRTELYKQKSELEQKINTTPDGKNVFANEAAVLELTTDAVSEKLDAYKAYMEKLNEQWSATANMISAEQQGEAMQEYAEDMGKIMEVARRIMNGGIVPPNDEKRLMDYSMELYQAAKNIGAIAKRKEKEEYDSLWEEEEEQEPVDAMEEADNAEAFAEGPEIVSVDEVVATSSSEE